jgi:hypothetical protein
VLSSLEDAAESLIPAGYTYFGQFIDHDVSYLLENADTPTLDQINKTVDVSSLTLARKPALDLDSVYGGGLEDSTVPFDGTTGKFVLGDTGFGRGRDFPRDPLFRPLIADTRNDDNLFVSQIQVLFMRLHNRIVDDLDVDGRHGADVLFAQAKAEVVKIYQYLVLHDFLKTFVPSAVYSKIVLAGDGYLTQSSATNPTMALEVSDAVFRLHSLVRSSYHVNGGRRSVDVAAVFRLAESRARTGPPSHPLLKAEDEVDWSLFFRFANYASSNEQQHAKRISVAINRPMRQVPNGGDHRANMLERNTLRGIIRGLCSGQDAVADVTARYPQLAGALGLTTTVGSGAFLLRKLSAGNSIRTRTPLWLYLMFEAPGSRLGVLGGWLLADTLRTAAWNASIRRNDPTDPNAADLYAPLVAMIGARTAMTIEDVIAYTNTVPPQRRRDSMSNIYDSWTGAGCVSGAKIFDTLTHKELDLASYPEIKNYLPIPSESDATDAHSFVGRVATLSKKTSAPTDIVKLFVNTSWNTDLARNLEDMEFTMIGNNLDRLRSDVDVDLDAGQWKAVGRVEVYRDLNPPGRPTAKIDFVNGQGISISAFWCWP